LFAFDTETTSLDYSKAHIVGVSFCSHPGKAAYIPLATLSRRTRSARQNDILEQLRPLLENPHKAKLGQNLKYDAIPGQSRHNALGIAHDTMLGLRTQQHCTKHNMDDLARISGLETIAYEDVAGKGAKQIPFQEVPLEQAHPTLLKMPHYLRLHQVLMAKLNNSNPAQVILGN